MGLPARLDVSIVLDRRPCRLRPHPRLEVAEDHLVAQRTLRGIQAVHPVERLTIGRASGRSQKTGIHQMRLL